MTIGSRTSNQSRSVVFALCALVAWSCRETDLSCQPEECAGESGQTGAISSAGTAGSGASTASADAAGNGGALSAAGDTSVAMAGAAIGDAGASSPAAAGGESPGNTGGIGGAPGSAGAGLGGAGGQCKGDQDCADALACNGQERCVAGACQSGVALTCGADLHCVEHAASAASCDYTEPGRWLSFLGSDTGLFPFELRALRLIGDVVGENHSKSISLSQGVVSTAYQLIDLDSWSPDGRHLIETNVKDIEHFDTNRLFLVEFGEGVPSAAVPLKDIPVGGSAVSGPWAGDSSAVFVRNGAAKSETYLVHFSTAGVKTELLFSEDQESSLHFCPDPRWFYREVGDDTRLVDSQNPKQEQLLWHGSTDSSPDGHWLLHSDDTGLWLATCESGTKPKKLSAVPSSTSPQWSSDWRFALVTHDTPADEIEVLDSTQQFQSVFKGTAADLRWAPSAPTLLLLGEPNNNAMQSVTQVDLSVTPAKKTARGSLPHPATWDFLTDDVVWAQRDEAMGLSGCWLLEKGTNTWRRLATQLSSVSPILTGADSYATFNQALSDGTTQILAFSLQDKNPTAIPLLPAPLAGDVYREFVFSDGLIASHLSGLEPFDGQFWWIGSSAPGFAQPKLLTDVHAATSPTLQPVP
jgi:hypothetical protein